MRIFGNKTYALHTSADAADRAVVLITYIGHGVHRFARTDVPRILARLESALVVIEAIYCRLVALVVAVVDIKVAQPATAVVPADRDLPAQPVVYLAYAAVCCVLVYICGNIFRPTTCIILYFFYSVKFVISIFYGQTVRICHFPELAVIIVIDI